MRTQQANTVVISAGSKGFEVYRVEKSGLEMFKGYFTIESAPSEDARIAMVANIKASEDLAAKTLAERDAMHALWASMSTEELRAHFQAQIDARRARDATRWA